MNPILQQAMDVMDSVQNDEAQLSASRASDLAALIIPVLIGMSHLSPVEVVLILTDCVRAAYALGKHDGKSIPEAFQR